MPASALARTIDETFSERFTVERGHRLELDYGDGDVLITPWSEDEVAVEVRYLAEIKRIGPGSDGDFDVAVVDVAPGVVGGQRLEANVTVPFTSLTEDTWFVVVVKGTDGVCAPLFPVFPANLSSGSNDTLADLMDGNVGENGVMALGATNALYLQVTPP